MAPKRSTPKATGKAKPKPKAANAKQFAAVPKATTPMEPTLKKAKSAAPPPVWAATPKAAKQFFSRFPGAVPAEPASAAPDSAAPVPTVLQVAPAAATQPLIVPDQAAPTPAVPQAAEEAAAHPSSGSPGTTAAPAPTATVPQTVPGEAEEAVQPTSLVATSSLGATAAPTPTVPQTADSEDELIQDLENAA